MSIVKLGSAPHIARTLAGGTAAFALTMISAACCADETYKRLVLEDSNAQSPPPSPSASESVRSGLSHSGILYRAMYTGEVFSVVSGGINQETRFHSLLEAWADIDFEKLASWNGLSFHANMYRSDGTGITLEGAGTIAAVSHIEATPATRLFELWFEQSFVDRKISLRFGQLAADAEFATLDSSGAFISSTFGWNTLMTNNMTNGGPIYPLATPGIRLKIEPNDNLSAMLALYNGDPVGPCDGDPQKCNDHGTNFRFGDAPLVMAELAYNYLAGWPGTIKVGGWRSVESFDDQHFDANGISLANTASSGVPEHHNGNYGLYGVIYQTLYSVPENADNAIHLFARAAVSPEDRNEIDTYVEGGLTFSGFIPNRPDDVLGIGVAYSHIGKQASALDRDQVQLSGVHSPIRDFEALLEISYQTTIAPGWILQPDFQYYWHPGGNTADPQDASGKNSIENAVVLGLRTKTKY